MKKLMVVAAMIAAFGLGGAAAFAASTDKPPSPPGQGECGHGNTGKPCKEDPQPDRGKDCENHGNHGGVNEDHCKGEETTPTETTPTTPTETTPTTPTETTTTSTRTTPPETTPDTDPAVEEEEAQQQDVVAPSVQQQVKPTQSGAAAVAGPAVAGAAARPSKAAQPAPFTP